VVEHVGITVGVCIWRVGYCDIQNGKGLNKWFGGTVVLQDFTKFVFVVNVVIVFDSFGFPPIIGEATDDFISYTISKLITTNLQPSQYKLIK
jgi:hypothetical protein